MVVIESQRCAVRVPLQHFQAAVAIVVLVVLSVGAAPVAVDLPDIGSMGLLARVVLAVFVLAVGGGVLEAVARPAYNRVRSGDAAE